MPDFGFGKPMTQDQIEHYFEVKRERKKQGLPVFTEQMKWDRRANENGVVAPNNQFRREEVIGSDYPLLGMRFRDTEEDKTYIVDSVSNCWLDGYYIQMAIREEGTKSHALIFWQNISSEHQTIIDGVKEAQEKYEIIEK